ncbi:hypothetical protein BGW80DRAFT_1341800 [Lactifluus volemus]|nr:hypothetical protein BGW80DRAFT_1341800 [Lactifluus volemus]
MDLPPDPDRITVSSFDDKNWLFFFFLIFQLSVLVSNLYFVRPSWRLGEFNTILVSARLV